MDSTIVGVLDKALSVKPEGEFKSDTLDVNAVADGKGKHNSFTQHYKITKTQTVEVHKDEHSEDETNVNSQSTKTKKRHFKCFGKCFGKE